MRKQVRWYFRSSLCGMLSAAMIVASLIVPDMTVYASPQDETSMTTESEKDELVEGTTGEGEDADGENKIEDGNSGSSSEGGEGSGEGSGDGSDEDGDDKLDGEGEKNPDGDLTDDEDEKDVIDEDLKSDEEEEEDEEELSINPLAEGEYGTLLNGDFETEGDNGWDSAASWTTEGNEAKRKTDEWASNNQTIFFHFYNASAGTISLSQKIENVEPGDYSVSLQVDGEYTEDGTNPISVEVKTGSTSLIKKSLGVGPGWNKWNTIKTNDFEIAIPDGKSQVDIEVSITGTLNAGGYIDLDNIKLEPADENSDGTEKTFYYYVGDTDDEVGLYPWGSISSTAEKADWKVWNANDTYKMSPVSGYAGWYSIPITVTSDIEDTGFKILKKTDALDSNDSNALFACDALWSHNTEVFNKLASGTEKVYAVKNWKCYDGEDVKAILRNVTFYMYSEDVVPAIQIEGSGTIYAVNESAGTKAEVTTNKVTNSWGNPTWNMSKVAGTENWYQLSFVAPGEIKFDSAKMCGLLHPTDTTKNVYEWDADFLNGAGDGVDFTPVFAGKNYYYKGIFYSSIEEAEATEKITLEMLQELIAQAKR
ncbi:MAG: hypothetical protein K2N00_03395, partial [Lachnospiraceae bacterium]|nr:hypothetical protein [Lachnospiraceae bacterium]